MSQEADSPLATSTVDELWAELRGRFESAVLIANRRDKTNNNVLEFCRYWHGGKITALGLTMFMQASLQKSLTENDAEEEEG